MVSSPCVVVRVFIYTYIGEREILCVCVGEKGINLSKLYVYYCMALLA